MKIYSYIMIRRLSSPFFRLLDETKLIFSGFFPDPPAEYVP